MGGRGVNPLPLRLGSLVAQGSVDLLQHPAPSGVALVPLLSRVAKDSDPHCVPVGLGEGNGLGGLSSRHVVSGV